MQPRAEGTRFPVRGRRGALPALVLAAALSSAGAAVAANPVTRPTPAGDEARALAKTALGLPLSQRSVGPFTPVKFYDGAKVTLERVGGRRSVLRLADGAQKAGYVGVTAKLPPQMTVRQRQVLKVAAQRLEAGRARAVVSANSADGRSYQAGVYRTLDGRLKWAVWRRDAAGELYDLAVSPKGATLDRWTKVDLLSRWNRPGSQATLRVDGRRVATTAIRDLTGTLAARVTLGFGRPSSVDERGVMLVRAARVDSSIPTEPLVTPTAPTPDMIAKVPPPPPPPTAAASGPAPPADRLPGREIARADFESGDLRQWSGRQAVSSERIKVVGSPVREGLYSGRFEVRNGENPIGFGDRAEVQLGVNEREGDERWYSWSTMFDPSFPTADRSVWQVVSQWHCTCDGSPSVAFYVWEENYYFQVRNAQGTQILWRTGLDRGKWHDIVLRVKWSDDPSVGFVELWQNGVPVTGRVRTATLYPGESAYFKQGYYRRSGEPRTGIVYHDGFQATAV